MNLCIQVKNFKQEYGTELLVLEKIIRYRLFLAIYFHMYVLRVLQVSNSAHNDDTNFTPLTHKIEIYAKSTYLSNIIYV